MTTLTLQKDVRFQADERLDLPDLVALSTCKTANLKEMMLTLFEPTANGRVLYGFNASYYGLDVFIAAQAVAGPGSANGSFAVDVAGGILEQTVGGSTTITLPPNKTNYIHAYVLPTNSDSANRRFINNAVSPSEEYTQATYTRTTDAVGFYVLSNDDAVPDLGNFELTTVIGGVSVNLVALAAAVTGGASVSTLTDFRTMFMVYSNPASGSGITLQKETDGALAFVDIYDRDFDVRGIRSMFLRIADALNGITGGYQAAIGTYGTAEWWSAPTSLKEVIDARTDTATAAGQTSLAKRIDAAKSTHVTVGAADSSDFRTLADVITAFPGAQSHSIHVKDGTITEVGATTFAAWKLHLSGNGPDISVISVKGQLLFSATSGTVTIKDLSFTTNGVAAINTPFKFDATVTQLLVDNCVFDGSTGTGATGAVMGAACTGVGPVKFRNCTFIWNAAAPLFDSAVQGLVEPIVFENCRFYPQHINSIVFGTATSLGMVQFNGCYFGTTARTFIGLGILSSTLAEVSFNDCTFMNMDRLFYLNTTALVTLAFERCRVIRTRAPAVSHVLIECSVASAQGSRILITGCHWAHSGGFYFHTLGSPENTNLTVRDSSFSFYSLIAGMDFFSFSGGYPGGTANFVGCQFYYGNLGNGAVIRHYTGLASIVETHVNIMNCIFSAAVSEEGPALATSNGNYALIFDTANAAGTAWGQHFWVTGCHFIANKHATQLPIQLACAALTTACDYFLSYYWQNGTSNNMTDSGCEKAGLLGTYLITEVSARGLGCATS